MRFSTSFRPVKKLAVLASALMILPVAVACDTNTPDVVEDPAMEESMDGDVSADPTMKETEAASGETIVDIAAGDDTFSTLVAAVQAAGLVETLSAEGPYTVFAPTDEAFAALPEGILETLLLPENEEILTEILTYHVVSGEVPSSAIEPGAVPTVAGETVEIMVDGGSVMVGDATVVMPDVQASNGIIHVIDTVLLPPNLDLAAL